MQASIATESDTKQHVELAVPEQINKQLVVPEHDSATPVKPNEAAFIYEFLKEKGLNQTLEIGFAYGRSASHIVAATGKKHIVIDPFQDNYNGLGLENMERLGLRELIDFKPDFSHAVLPELHKEGRTFDFIFIDGDHKFDGIFVDFYYADLIVKPNGYLLFHDTWMRSTQLVMSFIKNNRKDYKKIDTPLRNLALYQKVGTDERDGMFFSGFYNFKSLFVHNAIIWMTTGKMTPLKKLLFKIKDIVK